MVTLVVGKFKGVPNVIGKVAITEDSGEVVIKDTMALWRDLPCVCVQDKVNRG